jgi:O-antigen/teichoic acid export membrane protein
MDFEKNRWYEILDIFNRIKKRDFKGYTGIAIKNSIYGSATTVVEKIGALIFVIILARILMPELFGLYSLALLTILLFVSFSDLGIGQTLVKFVSQALEKNKQAKAKAYIFYLAKIKIVFLFIIIIILAVSAKFISQTYYNKPLFLALIAGILYIFIIGIIGFIQLFFQATNNFKILFFKQLFFQILRLAIVPVLVLYSLQNFASKEINILIVILSLSLVWFLTLLFLLVFASKLSFLKVETEKLQKKEKRKLNKFILSLSVFGLSGLFFAYIDVVILGHFVLSSFVGYYQAAFTLIGAFTSLIFFSSVLLPIFSRIKGRRLERGIQKSLRITFTLSSIIFLFTFAFAPIIIKIIYGQDYSDSANLLRLLSFLLISLPLIFIYTSYFIARGKTKIITKLLIVSSIINIVLNYLLIIWLINYSPLAAVMCVCVATLTSKYFYLFGLIYSRKILIAKKPQKK